MSASLDAALLRAIAVAWDTQNQGRFGGRLRRPVFRIADMHTRLASWDRLRREIVVSQRFVREHAWGIVVEVLKHEMAHQFVHEVEGVVGETAHGVTFGEVCARFGIDAAATGLPAAPDVEPAHAKVIARIQKLLALAESPNLHEAEAAMNAAQGLLLRHNLSTADLGGGPSRWLHLGSPQARLSESSRLVAAVLAGHFFVEVIWVPVHMVAEGRRGWVLEVCGASHNLELASYVHDFLHRSVDRLWTALAGRAPRGGRRAFAAGLIRGFLDRLDRQATTHAEEGLVWKGDPASQALLRRRYPHIRRVRRAGVARTDAWREGFSAGKELVLHRPVAASVNRGNLLGS